MTQAAIEEIFAAIPSVKEPIIVINPLDAPIVLLLNYDPKIELHCYREVPRGCIMYMSKENWKFNKGLNDGRTTR